MMKLTRTQSVASLDVRVIGIGGAGCSSLTRLSEFHSSEIKLMGIDTGSGADLVRDFADAISIGNGFGSGGDSGVALDQFAGFEREVSEFIAGADVVVVLAGLGRGTGSGIAPFVSQISRESGALTLAAVNMPFEFEGRFRNDSARLALAQLQESADSVFVMRNDDLLGSTGENAGISLSDAFIQADRAISDSVRVIVTALEATDDRFVLVQESLRTAGKSVLLCGTSEGLHAGEAAVEAAFSTLVRDADLITASGASGITSAVIHVEGGIGLSAGQVAEAVTAVRGRIGSGPDIHVSSAREFALGQRLQVTLVLAGDVVPSERSEYVRFKPITPEVESARPAVLSIFETPRPIRRRGPMLLPAS